MLRGYNRQSGVGCNTSMASTKETESNRIEILRLLIAITSKAMYIPSSKSPVSIIEMACVLTK